MSSHMCVHVCLHMAICGYMRPYMALGWPESSSEIWVFPRRLIHEKLIKVTLGTGGHMRGHISSYIQPFMAIYSVYVHITHRHVESSVILQQSVANHVHMPPRNDHIWPYIAIHILSYIRPRFDHRGPLIVLADAPLALLQAILPTLSLPEPKQSAAKIYWRY